MKLTKSQSAALWLAALGLLCWVVTFGAWTDVWHDSGRPDFHLMGATDFDLRALACAFFLLPLCLAGTLIATVVSVRRA